MCGNSCPVLYEEKFVSVILKLSYSDVFCVLSRLASVSHRYSYAHESMAVDAAQASLSISTCVQHKDVAMV